MKRWVYNLLIAVFACIFLVSAWYLGSYIHESVSQKGKYDDLASKVEQLRPTRPVFTQPDPTVPTFAATDPTEQTEPPTEPTSPLVDVVDPETGKTVQVLREYAEIYRMNDHLVGWLEIPDTRISYPVMQTPEQTDYYLYRDFYREYSNHGCLYAREVCNIAAPSDNITIYGHRMKDGSMLAGLADYTDKAFWETHKYIYFDTLTEYHTYEILAVFLTTATVDQGFRYHAFVNAEDTVAFDRFVATCKELALYETGVTASLGDKLITLSTCEYSQANGRLVVVAKRIT